MSEQTAPEVGFTAHLWGGPFDGTTMVLAEDGWTLSYVCVNDPLLQFDYPVKASVTDGHVHVWSGYQPFGCCYRTEPDADNVFRFRTVWPA